MLLKRLTLKNFLSHDDTVLEFGPEEKLLLDGNSGAGKSAVVEAVVWSLYGVGRSDSRSLVRKGASGCEVRLLLDAGGKDIEIRRKFSDGKQTVSVLEGVPDRMVAVAVSGVRGTQEYIETKVVGASYELFVNSIVYPQDNPSSFVKQTATRRKELLLEIARASNLDELLGKTKEELVKTEAKLGLLDSQAEAAEEGLEASRRGAEGSDALRLELAQADIRLDSLKKEKDEYAINSLERAKAEVTLANISEQVKTLETLTLPDIDKKLKHGAIKAEALAKDLTEDIKSAKMVLDDLKFEQDIAIAENAIKAEWSHDMLALLKERPLEHDYELDMGVIESGIEKEKARKYPLCEDRTVACPLLTVARDERLKFLEEEKVRVGWEWESYVTRMSGYKAKLEALGDEPAGEDTAANLVQIRDCQVTLEMMEKTQASRDANLAAIRSEADHLGMEKDVNTVTLAKLKDDEAKAFLTLDSLIVKGLWLDPGKEYDLLMARKTELSTKLSMCAFHEEQVAKATKFLETTAPERTKLNSAADALRLLKDALSPNGIKAMVVDYMAPRLEERINAILGKMSDFRVRLDTQRPSADGEKNIEGLFILISNGNGHELDYDLFSGGQKVKISFAISEALAELASAKFRILDEAVTSLDSESTEVFSETLLSMQNRFSQLICISHIPEVKGLFNSKKTVVIRGGVSELV